MISLSSFALAAFLQLGAPGPPSSVPDGGADPRNGRATTPAASSEYIGAQGHLEVPSPRVAEADIELDGRLTEAAWRQAALLTGFTQSEPVEGVPASQSTEVRLLVTDDALWFAIRAHDDVAGGVRATLARRDSYNRSDDYVRVVLDTFGAQRRAFVFQVNPLGIQADGLWVEGGGGRGGPIDWNPDFFWASHGRVDEGGYTVEMRIPFKSLRFPDAESQDWGLQVIRRIQRNGYESSWAPLSREVANALSRSGTLSGLQRLDPGLFLEVNPVLTGSRAGAYDSDAGGLAWTPARQEMGLNLTYGLTSNLTLTGTVNPDFSQVEADAGQITVNQRFALFLPERRPFFLEGTDLFQMPRNLVYTRAVVNPTAAAKLSGKIGGTSVAYLGAVDDLEGGTERPVFNIVRVKRDVGASSTLGAVYTDRTLSGSEFNRVAGVDGRFVLGGRYTLEFMAAGSVDGRPGSDSEWGSLVTARVGRSGRSLSWGASFEDVSDAFVARSGFIRRVGVTSADARVGYTFRGGRGALVENWGPSLSVEGLWDRAGFWAGGAPAEAELRLSLSGSFRGNVGGSVSLTRSTFDTPAGSYAGLMVEGPEGGLPFTPSPSLFTGMLSAGARTWISSWERVRLSLGAGWDQAPLFERSTGAPVDLADRWNADVGVTLIPTGSLQAEVGLRHVALRRSRDGSSYSNATIPRLEARYQLTRSVYARLATEYSSQEAGRLLDPSTGLPVAFCDGEECSTSSATSSHRLSLDALVGYEPSPGTVFFVGYSRQSRDPSAFGFSNLQTRSEGLFVKASYRFRM